MSWVSCLEDAIERIDDAITLRQRSMPGKQKSPERLAELVKTKEAAQRLIDKSHKLQLDLRDDLEIVIDPTVDLPARLRECETHNAKLQTERGNLEREVRKLGDAVRQLRSSQVENKQLKDEVFNLQNKLGKCHADSTELRRKFEKQEDKLKRAARR